MFVRRRPLLRAAVVGGGAYVAGKKMAQRPARQTGQESWQDERASGPGQGGQARQEPQAGQAGAPGESIADQLRKLSELHEQGVLSDGEFAAAKAKLLGT